MREKGYKPRTINVRISSVNNLLKFLDLREYPAPPVHGPRREAQPEISRNEYLRLLSCAKILGQECAYLWTKLFACTGLNVENLPLLTVEAVQAGFINTSDGEQRELHIPTHLQAELTAYIRRSGIRTGPVFVTRTGKRINRTSVTASIQRLARRRPRRSGKMYPSQPAEAVSDNVGEHTGQLYAADGAVLCTAIGWRTAGHWMGGVE